MGSEMHSYLLHCTVDPAKHGLLGNLRAAHLKYIISNQDNIIYGGVFGPSDEPPAGICIALLAESLAVANAIARADPYAVVYSSMSVSEYQQRLPEKYQGQLSAVLGALTEDVSEMAEKGKYSDDRTS